MTQQTWVIAGLSKVCKTFREGFNSLPRLHFFLESPRIGIRFPDDYTRVRLLKLLSFHHGKHAAKSTQLMELREKYIVLSKELSALKRGKK